MTGVCHNEQALQAPGSAEDLTRGDLTEMPSPAMLGCS